MPIGPIGGSTPPPHNPEELGSSDSTGDLMQKIQSEMKNPSHNRGALLKHVKELWDRAESASRNDIDSHDKNLLVEVTSALGGARENLNHSNFHEAGHCLNHAMNLYNQLDFKF